MTFKIDEELPYCPGCGHHQIVHSAAQAFEKLDWSKKDVILVTDIGCVGLADKHFPSHTVHGLHGRSVALGEGIKFGLQDEGKQVIVFLGDGGATIGLQHLLEAARMNVGITVVVHNNMLYGMTGGQSSGFTPRDYKTTTEPGGSVTGSHDLPLLVHQAGASYSSRITTRGDVTERMIEAFSRQGFSLVEIVEPCSSYGQKYNPDYSVDELLSDMGHDKSIWRNQEREEYQPEWREESPSLLNELPDLKPSFRSSLNQSLSVLIGGSAGEGVQTASSVLCKAAILSNLEVAKKGEYPVTVGSGFSAAKVLFSPKDIRFTGFHSPDVAILTSEESLSKYEEMIENMDKGRLYLDSSLSPLTVGNDVDLIKGNYRDAAGKKGASLCAVSHWLSREKLISVDSLIKSAESSEYANSLKESIQTGDMLSGM